ncbi:hypothetical protein ACHAPT_005147 [Fusarium lateritium]
MAAPSVHSHSSLVCQPAQSVGTKSVCACGPLSNPPTRSSTPLPGTAPGECSRCHRPQRAKSPPPAQTDTGRRADSVRGGGPTPVAGGDQDLGLELNSLNSGNLPAIRPMAKLPNGLPETPKKS